VIAKIIIFCVMRFYKNILCFRDYCEAVIFRSGVLLVVFGMLIILVCCVSEQQINLEGLKSIFLILFCVEAIELTSLVANLI
jgi:hypothetical protein